MGFLSVYRHNVKPLRSQLLSFPTVCQLSSCFLQHVLILHNTIVYGTTSSTYLSLLVHYKNPRMLTPDEIVADGLQRNVQKKLEVRNIEGKGRGALAAEPIRAGSFVLEYKTHAVYRRREMKNHTKEYDGVRMLLKPRLN